MDRIHSTLGEKRRSLQGLASCESYRMDDADCALCGYGVAGFIARKAVDLLRAYGVRAGLLRPMTLEPFAALGDKARGLEKLVVVEMSHGQFGSLVERAVQGVPLRRFETYGGKVPDVDELVAFVRREV
jgi:pyruvate/2-oxoacid:ferredoxin oxidoreductase alpha subunit